jgi:hypothetical protein
VPHLPAVIARSFRVVLHPHRNKLPVSKQGRTK